MAIQLASTAGLIGALIVMLYDMLKGPCRPERSEGPASAVPLLLGKIGIALLTPLLEKNVVKKLSHDVPFVFSMSRIIVLTFAVGMMRQLWYAGIASWPEATLAIAIVLALPLLGAIERVPPKQMLDLAKTLVGRFGVGDVRKIASTYSQEPYKLDDHRND